jgi:dTMP kinase
MKLIVIEGLDGSGKSTQWEMLQQSLPDAAFITFPDYDSHSGKIIKQYLNGEFDRDNAYSASCFYAMDRYIYCQSSKLDGLTISARYTSSNAIYQMSKLAENEWETYLDWLYDLEFNKLMIPKPDLTVFLDVPIEISQKLLDKRYSDSGSKDIHEGDLAFLRGCKKAADFVSARDGWKRIDCVCDGHLRSPEDIHSELVNIIRKVSHD